MGNPHPTRSKPVPIGRKHTNAPGVRQRGRMASARAADCRRRLQMMRQFKAEVGRYFRNEREDYPANPFDKLKPFFRPNSVPNQL